MSIDQKTASLASKLFDRLPDDRFAKPQLETEPPTEANIGDKLTQALAEPLSYPPLADSIIAGDSIAIALQSNLPNSREVLEALLERLSSLDIEMTDIVVVITPRTANQLQIDASLYEELVENQAEGLPSATFPVEFGFHTIQFQVHQPENQAESSYLVANAEGEPVHVNRTLVDADVVLPIGSPNPGGTKQQFDCIYPEFSDETIRHRFASGAGSFLSRWEEIELANNLLGCFFSIQLVCGPGDTVEQIMSGERVETTNRAREATNRLWAFDWKGSSGITVATIESHADDQDWDDFAQALITASQLTDSEAPIVIWSEIGVRPDRKIRKACLAQFEEGISSKLTSTMQQVAGILKERPIYLHSNLNRSVVEELGLGFVESADQILRISADLPRGLLIRDAHKCQLDASLSAEEPNA